MNDELVKKCEMNSINIGIGFVFNWSGWAMGFYGPVSNDVKHQLKIHVKPSAWHFINGGGVVSFFLPRSLGKMIQFDLRRFFN